jgi:tape measure domain-containing protein
MLGSTSKANALVAQLRQFSTTTPFKLAGIAETTRMMLGFGVASEDIAEVLKRVGNVAAGANKSMSEIGMVYGQVKAKGRLQSEEMMQLAEKGVGIQIALEKLTGKSGKRFDKMVSKGKISFEMFAKAFASMSQEGGMYEDQMEKMSKTLSGRWSTMTDNVIDFGAVVGKIINNIFGLGDILKKVSEYLGRGSVWLEKWVATNPEISKWVGYLVAGLAVVGPLVIGLAGLGLVIAAISFGIPVLTGAIVGLTVGFGALLVTMAPFIAIAAVIASLAYTIYKNWDPIAAWFEGLWFVIAASLSIAADKISSMWDSVKTGWSSFSTWVKSFVNSILGFFSPFVDQLMTVAGIISNALDFGQPDDIIQKVTQSKTSIPEAAGQNAGAAISNRGGGGDNPATMNGVINVELSKGLKMRNTHFDMSRGNNVKILN